MRQTMIDHRGFVSRGREERVRQSGHVRLRSGGSPGLGECLLFPNGFSRLTSAILSVACAVGGLCLVLLLLHGTIC